MEYGQLEAWLLQETIPESNIEPFIVNHHFELNEADPQSSIFRFIVSSKHLLRAACDCERMHCDATYKLNWQGFPVLLIGMTDSERKFHPIGICTCSNEQTADFQFLFSSLKTAVMQLFRKELNPRVLICDAAGSIHAAFKNVFGDNDNIVMCWAHVRRNIVKNLPKHEKEPRLQKEFLCK